MRKDYYCITNHFNNVGALEYSLYHYNDGSSHQKFPNNKGWWLW